MWNVFISGFLYISGVFKKISKMIFDAHFNFSSLINRDLLYMQQLNGNWPDLVINMLLMAWKMHRSYPCTHISYQIVLLLLYVASRDSPWNVLATTSSPCSISKKNLTIIIARKLFYNDIPIIIYCIMHHLSHSCSWYFFQLVITTIIYKISNNFYNCNSDMHFR